MIRLLRTARDEGVHAGLALPVQADRMLTRQLGQLRCWMHTPLGTRDWGNPYGKNRFLHDHHGPDWPATWRERRAGERQVERVRRRIRPSCWRTPPRWSWAAHGLPLP
jgi:hypothetical protein